MEGVGIILYIGIIFLFVTIIIFVLLFTNMTQNCNKYLRIFPLLFMINAFCSFSNEKMGWSVFFLLVESMVISTVVLLLSFIKKTKILNWIYAIPFSILSFICIYAFIGSSDKQFAYLFVSFFFSICISSLIFWLLKKQEYKISIWGLACNIEILIIVFHQWFFHTHDIWYFTPHIVISIFALIIYLWFILKRKHKKIIRQEKENPKRFMPK